MADYDKLCKAAKTKFDTEPTGIVMDRTTELLVALHDGLRGLGPGSPECTLKALDLCGDLPPAPDILDVGCGTEAQTLVLASAIDGGIVATDLIGALLSHVRKRASETGLGPRIRTVAAAMHRLPFVDHSHGPLKQRLPDFRRTYSGDPEAQGQADLTELEMLLMGRHAEVCGCELFVLRRDA